ncbi:Cell wall-associated hydrolase, NlpC family [Pustulibacterium marinum]|uniref:Cell wall-associated hydrolase, NlpC family n=2 Tax=Pustulibacterium marinum TaxID=1224947 RepID=A0A1I7EV27_9FLAO|nr:Cell wall-associated hydrolase, NlpC family [Pustulibacterium marinum]
MAMIAATFYSCGSKKKAASKKENSRPSVTISNTSSKRTNSVVVSASGKASSPKTVTESSNNKINDVVESAMSFLGTRYKYGGTTKKGMDCSGLVYTSLLENDIIFERSSYLMSQEGDYVKLKNVIIGDLLFFSTGKSKRVNHVGLVIALEGEDVKFIHSTTSRGVIISSIKEGYWSNAYKTARRIKY